MRKYVSNFFLILLVHSLSSIVHSPVLASSEPTLRIALLKNISEVTIEGNDLHIRTPEEKPAAYAAQSPLTIVPTKTGFKTGVEIYNELYLKIISVDKKLAVNGKAFEGDLEIRRTAEGKLLVLNEIPIEIYLVGLIHGEINANWPREAIKAQAVAARTYALYKKGDVPPSYTSRITRGNVPYDLEVTTADQVYAGSQGEKDRPVKEAIAETSGEVLWYQGYYPAYFHSCCGGQTETTEHVWERSEISTAVIDPFCKNSPKREWSYAIATRDFLKKLAGHGLEGGGLKSIQPERFETSPRNAFVTIETNTMTLFLKATDLRRILGYENLKSTWFNVEANSRQVSFKGTGFGHGVGLCQWGAKAMAEAGKSYREILDFYYPKGVVRKIY